jgi:hypothetical protein
MSTGERFGGYLLLVMVLVLCGLGMTGGRFAACVEQTVGGVPETHWPEGAPPP